MIRAFRPALAGAGVLALVWAAAGCGGKKQEVVHPIGTPVVVGDLSYTVLNTEWRDDLQTELGPRRPKHRFLLVSVSITNNGPEDHNAPLLAVIGPDGKETLELDKGDGVPQWMGLLRRIPSTRTEVGTLLFDVPPGDYRLRVSSGGEMDREQTALISLPYRVEAPAAQPTVEPRMPPSQ